MLTKSMYDLTSRRYFSILMLCSDNDLPSQSPSIFTCYGSALPTCKIRSYITQTQYLYPRITAHELARLEVLSHLQCKFYEISLKLTSHSSNGNIQAHSSSKCVSRVTVTVRMRNICDILLRCVQWNPMETTPARTSDPWWKCIQ